MDYEDEALREITHVMWNSKSSMMRTLERNSHGEMFVMRELMMFGARTPTQLAQALNVTVGRISSVVSALMKKGWVTRSEDPHDRRRVVVELSEEGREAVQEHNDRMYEHLRWVFSQMGQRRTREFVDLVSEFVTYMSLVKQGESAPSAEEVREAFERRDVAREELRASMQAHSAASNNSSPSHN